MKYKCKLYFPEHSTHIIYDDSDDTKMCEINDSDWDILNLGYIHYKLIGEIIEVEIDKDPSKYFKTRRYQILDNEEQKRLKAWQEYIERCKIENGNK